MTEPLLQLAYVSQAAEPFSDDDLAALMKVSRRRNRAVAVTGMLLFDDGLFLQILEGPADSVQACFDRIRLDPRHTDVQTVYVDRHCPEREFAKWNMGCKILGRRLAADYRDMDDRVRRVLDQGRPQGELAHQLLLDFRAVQDAYVDLPETD